MSSTMYIGHQQTSEIAPHLPLTALHPQNSAFTNAAIRAMQLVVLMMAKPYSTYKTSMVYDCVKVADAHVHMVQ